MKCIAGALAVAGVVVSASTGVAQQEDIQPPAPNAQQRAAPGDLGMAIMSALVGQDGALIRGEGAISSRRANAGIYVVTFGRDVRSCVYAVTPNGNNRTTRVQSGAPDSIIVVLFDPIDRVNADTPFYVIVYCGR